MNIHAGALFQLQRVYLKLSGKLSFFFASCNNSYCHFPPRKHPAKYYLFPWKIPCVPHWNGCGCENLCLPLKLCCDSLQSHTFHTIQVPHRKSTAGVQTQFLGMLPRLVYWLKWGSFWSAADLFDVATAFLGNLPCQRIKLIHEQTPTFTAIPPLNTTSILHV